MGELTNKYRLVLITKQKNEGAFKQYFYFNKNEDGMKLIRLEISESIRLINDKRFDYLDKDLEFKAYAIESYKKTEDGHEMSSEIEYEILKSII